jgi:hypothetical protein
MPPRARQSAEALFKTSAHTPHPARPTPQEIKRRLGLTNPPATPSSEPIVPSPLEPRFPSEHIRQLQTLYQYGLTKKELAEHFGVPLKAIEAALVGFTRKRR